MLSTNTSTEERGLDDFFSFIWEDVPGYVYLALKSSQQNHLKQFKWEQFFFQWPQQKSEILSFVVSKRSESEVYFGPAIYSAPASIKSNVKSSNVFWAEFDGRLPETDERVPPPTCRIRSSDETHEHHYWKSNTPIPMELLEAHNRTLTYFLGADVSGWDATQVLRVPFTFNHKRKRPVVLLAMGESKVDPVIFEGLPQPPPLVDVPSVESIPDIDTVIAKYQFSGRVWNVFKNGLPGEQRRSDTLMTLGYHFAEMQMDDGEALSMLLNADNRIGKFSNRPDQLVRLTEIITRARVKYPYKPTEKEKFGELKSIGLASFLATEVHMDWIWEGFLQQQGYLLISGKQGVGKTQFSLHAAMHMALGMDFLETKIAKPRKVGFFSLEMGFTDLKQFLAKQAEGYTEEQMALMEENFRIFPMGEPIHLDAKDEQKRMEEIIHDEKLDGIMVDSLGSCTGGELSQEGPVKEIMGWNDRLRQRHGIFTWFIHHHRKATSDNKRPNKLDDVYGNQYITGRATTVICLWESGQPQAVDLIPLKVRLAAKPAPFPIYRDHKLQFTKTKAGLFVKEEVVKEAEGQVTKKDPTKGVSFSF